MSKNSTKVLIAQDIEAIRTMNISHIDLEELQELIEEVNSTFAHKQSVLPVMLACGKSMKTIDNELKALFAIKKVMIAYINLKIAIDENTAKGEIHG